MIQAMSSDDNNMSFVLPLEVSSETRVARATDQESNWSAKQLKLDDVPSKIHNGSNIYIGSAGSTALASLTAVVSDHQLADIQIIQMIPAAQLPHLNQSLDRIRSSSFFSYRPTSYFKLEDSSSHITTEALADYTPISISSIPRLLKEKKLPVDVAIIKVTPPHKGFVSLGLGVEYTRDFVRYAKTVIAEVNLNMPWTEGPSKLSVNEIDYWVEHHEPIYSFEQMWPDLIAHMKFIPQEVLDGIGRNAIKEIPNKATLKFGWSPISLGIYKFLRRRKDLGLHTDGLSDELCELIEEGVINNKYKTIDTGRSVVSFAFGSQATYNFIDRNPAIEFHPGRYVNDPQVLAKIDNLVAIVGALKVDLTGQIATDSIKHKFYGGVWSDVETIRGARLSEGGKALVLLQSESVSGRSNIVFALPPGTGVSITRSDVEYVITDYGTAYLDGKSVRERALALINIAHPKYRDGLLAEAKQHGYISERQPGKSFRSIYPEEFECLHTTTTGKQVFVRPIKIVDEGALRSFFHALSDRSVYLRYFRRLPSMPQRILQQYTDVDYTRDMALVVLYPPDSTQQQLVAIGQWISDLHDNVPEIAFQVLDEWQGQGLGLYLFQRLVEISRFFGIPKFKADVLGQNRGMQAVFKKSGIPYMTRTDFGTITYLFDLTRNEEEKKSSSN